MASDDDYIEIDTPWFDAEWRYLHPDYPLSTTLSNAEVDHDLTPEHDSGSPA